MKQGDIYFRPGSLPAPTGVITKPEKIIQREFASYKIVYYTPYSDGPNYFDLIRVTDGPDYFLAVVIEDLFEFRYSLNNKWVFPLHRSFVFYRTPEGFFEILVDLSEKELEEQFELAFKVG